MAQALVNYQLALDEYSEAICLKPDYLDAFNNRGLGPTTNSASR